MSAATRVSAVVAVAASLGLVSPIASAQSEFGAWIDLWIARTDNIELVPADSARSEDIADLRTGFNFDRTQGRLDASVGYQVQGIFYDETVDQDEVFHQLDVYSRLELASDRLFFEVYGVYDQVIVDPTQPFSFNNRALTGNRTDVAILGASPSIALGVGGNVEGEIRQSFAKVNYDDPILAADMEERFTRFYLANSNRRAGGSWAIEYSQESFEYELPAEVEFEFFELELGFWVNPRVRFFTTQGLEGFTEQVGSLPAVGVEDERYWYIGGNWSPTVRTNLTVWTGERIFGRSERFEWYQALQAGGVRVTYDQRPSTFWREPLLIAQATGELNPIDTLDGPLGNYIYISERIEVAYLYDRGQRSNFGLRFFDEQRFDIADTTITSADEPTEQLRGTEANFSWSFADRTSLGAGLQRARRRSMINVTNDTLTFWDVTLAHRVGARTQMSISYTHEESDPEPNSAMAPYEENQIMFRWGRGFGSGTGRVSERYSEFLNSGVGSRDMGL